MCVELGRLSKKYKKEGTDTIKCMAYDKIKTITKNHTVTHTIIVVYYRAQKADPNRVCITAVGNLIDYLHKITTHTADLTTKKIMWKSIISTEGAN